MDDGSMIRERLRRLERHDRRWDRATLATLIGLAAALAGGAGASRPPAAVEAERFIIRDAKRNVRVSLGHDPVESRHELFFYDPGRKPRLGLVVFPEALAMMGLRIMDQDGISRGEIGQLNREVTIVNLGEEARGRVASMSLNSTGSVEFGVGNMEPRGRAFLFNKQGQTSLMIHDRSTLERAFFGFNSHKSQTKLLLKGKPKGTPLGVFH